MNVLIVGGGSIGTTYGAYLSKAVESVTLLVRREEHAKAVNAGPVKIRMPDNVEECSLKAVTKVTPADTFDLVLFSTKVYDLERALESARPAVKPDTVLLSIQNGVQHYDLLQAVYPENITIGAVSYSGLNRISDTEVKSAGTFRSLLGRNDNAHKDVLQKLEAMFQAANMAIEVRVPIKVALWEKQMLTSIQQILGALTDNTFGQLLASSYCKTIAFDLYKEAYAVAKAEGVTLPEDTFEKILKNWARIPSHYPSMRADFKAGWPTESFMANGCIVQLAEKHGIDAAVNKVMYNLIKAMEENRAACSSPSFDVNIHHSR